MVSKTSMGLLKTAGQGLLKAAGDKALSSAEDGISGLTDRLEGMAEGQPFKKAAAKGAEASAQGNSPVMGAIKGMASGVKDKITGGGGGNGGGGKATKSTNIIESIDVGVPIDVAYNAWTEFSEFPSFMKKVENVEAADDTKLEWKAQIFWSHRSWEATILDQIPNERIVWRSKGQKGHVDGSVTFHELGPSLTRILVVLEYYPQGFMEKTGNIWRAQGRRARVELKHFRRHVMTRSILEADEIEGWRGVIEDGEVVKTHEEALEEEEQEQAESDEDQPDDEAEDQPDDEYDEPEEGDEGDEPEEGDEGEEDYEEGEPEDEYEDAEEEPEEPEDSEDSEDEEYEDESEDEPEDEYEEPEDEEYEESDEEDEEPRARRRRAS